jgi:hypothetical protein
MARDVHQLAAIFALHFIAAYYIFMLAVLHHLLAHVALTWD